MRAGPWSGTLLVCWLLAARVPAQDVPTLELPVRVHVLKSDTNKALNATISDDEIKAIFERVNQIWSPARVRWSIESIVKGDAQNGEGFERLQKLGFMKDVPFQRKTMTSLYPRDKRLEPGWNLFFIADFGVMPVGVYHPATRCMIVAQKSNQFPLNPSIVAHELGHSLGLQHTPKRFSLMAGRQPGVKPEEKIRLDTEEINKARSQAMKAKPFEGRLIGVE